MRLLHQVSLFILTLLFIFLTFNIGIYAFGWLPETYFPLITEYIFNNMEIGLVSVILFLMGIWLLQSLFQFKPAVQTIVQQTEMGEVRISVSAIKGLVEQVVLEQSGIKGIKPRFNISDEHFVIFLQLSVSTDAHIPTLGQDTAKLVKEHLNKMVGLKVDEVKILVEEIETPKKTSSSTVRVR